MTNTAAVTYAILEFLQTNPAASETAEWTVWPAFVRVGRQELTELLASIPKPALIGILAEPHAIIVLPFDDTSHGVRARLEQERQNQQLYFASKYAGMSNTEADSRILFGTPARQMEILYPTLAQWMGEFVISSPWSILQHAVEGEPPVRFRIRRSDRKWST